MAGGEVTGEQIGTIVSRVAEIAIMIFFGIMAAQLLGAAIIAVGFLIAGFIGRIVTQPMPSRILRYTTIAPFAAMALKNMGLADSIVNLAFGSVVGGALAAARVDGGSCARLRWPRPPRSTGRRG